MGFYKNKIHPLAKALDKAKWKGFDVMYTVWLIDLATTAIALGWFSDRLIEGNPVAAMFFSLGLLGWLLWIPVAAGIMLGLLYLPDGFMKISSLINNKKSKLELRKQKDVYDNLRLLNVTIIVVAESLIILSNINNLINVI